MDEATLNQLKNIEQDNRLKALEDNFNSLKADKASVLNMQTGELERYKREVNNRLDAMDKSIKEIQHPPVLQTPVQLSTPYPSTTHSTWFNWF